MEKREPPPGVPDMEAVYDAIAEAWARTRSGPWPAVTGWLAGVPRGAVAVDLGAGSGRYFATEEARGLRMIGLDVSRGQLAVARRAATSDVRLVRADARSVPLRAGCVSAVLCIAVLHHFFDRRDRVDVVRQARRVAAPGARALFSVWGLGAEVFREARHVEGGGPSDFVVPFKEGQHRPMERFFHAYGEGELSAEVQEGGFSLMRAWVERENHFVEAIVEPTPSGGGAAKAAA